MSTEQVIAWRVICDITGCNEATEPQSHPADADEDALEAGWHLDERQGRDKCPTHAQESPC